MNLRRAGVLSLVCVAAGPVKDKMDFWSVREYSYKRPKMSKNCPKFRKGKGDGDVGSPSPVCGRCVVRRSNCENQAI